MDAEEFREIGKQMVDFLCDYVKNVEKYPVTATIEPGYLRKLLPEEAPQNGEKWDQIFDDIRTKIIPGVTHWNHPKFFAYFPAGNSFPSILGDMLSDVFGSIGFSWISFPVCTELEVIVLDWFAKAIGLPDQFISSKSNFIGGGVIMGSASEAVLTCILAAKKQTLSRLKAMQNLSDEEIENILSKLVAYTSLEAHSSVEKACKITDTKLRILETDDYFSLRGKTLQDAIENDIQNGFHPFITLATLGTTGCGSFDNILELGRISEAYNIWLHVDASYAGSAFICPELRHFMKGVEYVNSISVNANKWLLVNFDCTCLWIKEAEKLRTAMTVEAMYYHPNDAQRGEIDFRHWGIPLSRRFRSLKLWFVLRTYGIKGLQSYIRNHIQLAKYLQTLIEANQNFEILNDVHLGLVCFRLKGSDDMNHQLVEKLNYSRQIHLTPTKILSKHAIRFCVVYEYATKEHIDKAWALIQKYAKDIMLELKKEELERQNLQRQL